MTVFVPEVNTGTIKAYVQPNSSNSEEARNYEVV